ncbi:MAG: ATP-binding protein [Methyloceanibacter sp.]|uniref:ATP-binding protein n=1 Tax=Methyloceanibacter sp. TaxID=1965321 RepID=UPI003EE06551
MLQKLWYDRPVRTQLLVAVAAINLLAALVAGAVSIFNTRTATQVEMEASLEVAQRFVAATLKDLSAQGKLDQLNQELPLQLKHLRHVRIMFMDDSGQLNIVSPHAADSSAEPYAPAWFAALVRPEIANRKVRVVAGKANPIVVLGEPADEIAEAWQDFASLAVVWLGINALVLIILYVVLGRVLDPLANLSKGMLLLEDGHYTTRLKPSKVKELAAITNRFNTLAGALDMAREENSRLYRQLITVQEEERREIANELHDEAGPCLFGIAANASSIQTIADRLPKERTVEISRRVGEILSIAERLKAMNRALIKKLRPGPLGRVTLAELIAELTAGLQGRHLDTQIHTELGKLAKSYGEPVDLTVYRCIQEAITNAIRHGHAANITVELTEKDVAGTNGRKRAAETVQLTVTDDGKGMAPSTPTGFGLTTMTERVRSLGGACVVESAPSKGTSIRVEIPVQREGKERTRAPELVGELS